MEIREAIILAAGLGTRLRGTTDVPKPLVRVLGIPLILYPIAALLLAGVARFYVVANPRSAEPLAALLDEVGLDHELIVNEQPERGNGFSLVLGIRRVRDSRFFVSMSDHIFSPAIPRMLVGHAAGSDLLVGADSSPRYINVEEATKILVREGMIQAIGKGLERYSHVDIGIFIMSRGLADAYREYSLKHRVVELAALIQCAVARGFRVRAADVRGEPWLDVDTPEDLQRAQRILETEEKMRELLERVRRLRR